ncbi:MAG: DUF2189 domain-containing protein [Betaproteobacteria bacterium]|jgi:uncharacterized membrane protein|nr:DUF2189 domain-containing protein [Betaproteobacteria bacterium]MDH5286244.1 DUF2189 domain-containing protein [Betaproteobacteria bacterium]
MPTRLPDVRKIGLGAPLGWLASGWRDFRASWRASAFYGLVFALMGWLVALVFRHAYEYVWGLTTGFLLVGPFLAIGIYELSRRRERGEPPWLAPTLDAWRPNVGAIGIFALVLGVLLLVWSRASLVVIAVSFPDEMPSLERFLANVLAADNLQFLLGYFAIGGFFAALVFAISVVSVPMMLDRDTDGVVAALTSLRACRENVGPMLVWAALIALVVGAGFALWFLGLVVAVPVIGHATWHAYKALVA